MATVKTGFSSHRISLIGRQGSAGSASQSEAMTIAVGFSPRGGSAKTGRRGATLEGLDWLLASGVAPRRAPFPHHYSVGSSPRLPSRSRSATSQKARCAPLRRATANWLCSNQVLFYSRPQFEPRYADCSIGQEFIVGQ